MKNNYSKIKKISEKSVILLTFFANLFKVWFNRKLDS